MNYVQQCRDLAEVREFSTKEVCDILSSIMLMNEQGIQNDLSIKDVIQNACSNEHSANVIMQISQHVQDVTNAIAENREVDDINAMKIAFGPEY